MTDWERALMLAYQKGADVQESRRNSYAPLDFSVLLSGLVDGDFFCMTKEKKEENLSKLFHQLGKLLTQLAKHRGDFQAELEAICSFVSGVVKIISRNGSVKVEGVHESALINMHGDLVTGTPEAEVIVSFIESVADVMIKRNILRGSSGGIKLYCITRLEQETIITLRKGFSEVLRMYPDPKIPNHEKPSCYVHLRRSIERFNAAVSEFKSLRDRILNQLIPKLIKVINQNIDYIEDNAEDDVYGDMIIETYKALYTFHPSSDKSPADIGRMFLRYLNSWLIQPSRVAYRKQEVNDDGWWSLPTPVNNDSDEELDILNVIPSPPIATGDEYDEETMRLKELIEQRVCGKLERDVCWKLIEGCTEGEICKELNIKYSKFRKVYKNLQMAFSDLLIRR